MIVAVNGYHPISAYKRALLLNGTFVMVGGSEKQLFQFMMLGPWISMSGDKKMNSFMHKAKLLLPCNNRKKTTLNSPLELRVVFSFLLIKALFNWTVRFTSI